MVLVQLLLIIKMSCHYLELQEYAIPCEVVEIRR